MRKSVSTPGASSVGGIKIILHRDGEAGSLLIQDYGKTFKAEDLCIRAAKNCNIGTLTLYMFALARPDLSSWLPPNHPVECLETELQTFLFRIRYIPPSCDKHLHRFCKLTPETFDYFYTQCRDDFVNDRIDYKIHDSRGKKIGQEHLLGLAVIDMLRYGKERDYDLNQLKKLDPGGFISLSSKASFKFIWDKKRLSINFKPQLEKEFRSSESDSINDVKIRYVRGLFSYAKQYGMESFEVCDTNCKLKIIVDPYDETNPGIYCEMTVGKESPIGEHFAAIEDLMDVSISDDPPGMVHINRKTGMPKVINFPHKTDAYSFVSLLDGYYRLQEDFHHHLCRGIESPMIAALKRIRSHGPVSKDWARNRLMERHNLTRSFNFLLFQRSKEIGSYVMAYIKTTKDTKSMEFYTLNLLEDGTYQLGMSDQPVFPDMRTLLEHYKSEDSPHIRLEKCVPPAKPVDPKIYVCRDKVGDGSVTGTPKPQKAEVSLVSDVRIVQRGYGDGLFTEIHKGTWEKKDSLNMVAVKQLKAASRQYLEMFIQGVHQTSFWSHPTIVSVYAICLSSPCRVLLELADLGTLESYLTQPHLELKVYHLVIAAEQIAQALCYLQEEKINPATGLGEVHGNIRSRNILVFDHDPKGGLKVKLGDPGMVHLYNIMSISSAQNVERLPWVAPECYSKLHKADNYSDRYAFGITLWELFASGDRPFTYFKPEQIMEYVLQSRKTLLCPKQCPPDMYSLMVQCWELTPENRPGMKEVVRNIRHLLTQESGNDYNDPQWIGQEAVPPSPTLSSLSDNSPSSHKSSGVQRAMSENSANQRIGALMKETVVAEDGPHPPHSLSLDSDRRRISSQSSVSPSGSSDISSIWDSNMPLIPRSGSTSSSTANLSPTSTTGGSNFTMISHVSEQSLSQGPPTPGHGPPTPGLPQGPPSPGQGPPTPGLPQGPPTPGGRPRPGEMQRGLSIQNRPLPAPPMAAPHTKEQEPLARERIHYNKKESPLGQGHYGQVFKGLFQTDSGNLKPVAIKCLKPKNYNKYALEFEKEFQIMVTLKHHNIVNIIGQCPQRDQDHPMLLVMEYVENGCLREYLRARKKELSPAKLVQFSQEIAEGMVYLSKQNVVHRDLAARNVLVTQEECAKISDFGLSRALGDDRDYYRSDQSKEIPAPWCAPEALMERKFTVKGDVWSYGITVWEIFSLGKSPDLCAISQLPQQLHAGKRLTPKYGKWPDGMYRLILKHCWQFYPEDRSPFEEILTQVKEIGHDPK